jgi:hypothetical protein
MSITSDWQLTSSSDHAVDSSDQDTTTFPVWTNVISGSSGYTTVTNASCY